MRGSVLSLGVELVVAVALWTAVVASSGWVAVLLGVVGGLVLLHLLVTVLLLVGAWLGLRALQRWIDARPARERCRLR